MTRRAAMPRRQRRSSRRHGDDASDILQHDRVGSLLLGAEQAMNDRRPAVDFALYQTGELGRAQGPGLDCIPLDLLLDLRAVEGPDNLAVEALDDWRCKP